MINKKAVIELSHPMIPGDEKFKLEVRNFDVTELLPHVTHRPDIWYILSDISFSSHVGTHIEFPFHHLENGLDAASYPLENLIGEAVVLDFSGKKTGSSITLNDVKAQEERIRGVDMVFFRTDRDKLFRTEKWNEEVYIATDALEWLISLDLKVIGTDCTGFEVPGTDHGPNHLLMFKHNVAMVESATNLAAIGIDRVVVFILPLRIKGIDSCPVRIVAFRKEDIFRNR